MKRWLLILLVGMLLIPLRAQDTTDLPDSATQPPALLVLFLLDDTLTNINRGEATATSASTVYGLAPVQRGATDPLDARGQAIVNMMARLQADSTTTHEVGVLRFATEREAPQWLTGDDTSPFILLGGDGSNAAAYTESVNAILNRADYNFAGPGDTALALSTAQEVFISEVQSAQERDVKPVVVLLTDDVPIQTWSGASSPWLSAEATNWQSYIDEFEAPLRTLASASPYDGYCAASSGITTAVFAMGAANWVNTDGSIAYDTSSQTITADGLTTGLGDYFPTLLTDLNSINPRTETPYIYALDPAFEDATGLLLQNELLDQASQFITDARCLYPMTTTSEDDLSATIYTLTTSALMEQVTLVMEVQPNTTLAPTLTLPDGSTTTPAIVDGSATTRVLRLNRADAQTNWTGQWSLRVERGQVLYVETYATLDYSGVTAVPQSPPENLVQNEDFTYSIELRDRYGQPIRDDFLIDALALQVGDDAAFEPMAYDPATSVYTRTVVGDEIASEGTYDINARLRFASLPPGVPQPVSSQEFAFGSLSTSSQLNLGRPPSIGRLACANGTDEIAIPISFDTTGNADSVASYMRVEAFYGEGEVPITVLAWDFENRFVGTIDCRDLAAGEGQEIVIRGVLPDGQTQERTLTFSFEPTPTPTMLPSPTANPLPTPTPAPPGPNYVNNLTSSATSFPLNYILLFCLAVGGVRFGWVMFTSLRRTLIPLENVYLEVEIGTSLRPREPLLSGLRRYNPFTQNRTFYQDDTVGTNTTSPNADADADDSGNAQRIRLFKVSGVRGGSALRITVMSRDVTVNGETIRLNASVDVGRREVTIRYAPRSGDRRVYRLYNNYGR